MFVTNIVLQGPGWVQFIPLSLSYFTLA